MVGNLALSKNPSGEKIFAPSRKILIDTVTLLSHCCVAKMHKGHNYMNETRNKLSAAILLCLICPLVARAQNADGQAQADQSDGSDQQRKTQMFEKIVVTADRTDSFSADFLQAGAFRDSRVLDTPLTVSVMTKDILDAQFAEGIMDAARNTPGVTQSQINSNIYSNLSIRGIPVNNQTNYRFNGVLPIVNLIDMPMEDKDRVEILKGAGGLYYGFASPSGIVNLVSSRYLQDPMTSIELSGNGFGGYGAHVDVSTPFSSGGSRFNAGAYSLENGVDRSDGNRYFVSEAFDWNLTDKLSVQLDGEYIKKTITEATEFVAPTAVNNVINVPKAVPNTTNVGSPWFKSDGYEYNVLGRLRYDISDRWSASASLGESYIDTTRLYSSFYGYNLGTGNGTLSLAIFPDAVYRAKIFRGDLSGIVETGPIVNNILSGVSYYTMDSITPLAQRYSFAQNLYSPALIPVEAINPRVASNIDSIEEKALFVTTRSSYEEWLNVILGYRKTDYEDASLTSDYKVKPDTWSYGLLIKPTERLSAYWNYIEALESGGIAQQIATNGGQTMPALLSNQTEFGLKFEPKRGLLLTLAHFNIDRASEYLNANNLYVEDGRASYKGYELSLTGEATQNLSLSVSAVSLDAIQKSGAANVVGKRIENTAKLSGSVFVEYKIPALNGLSISAGAFYTGDRAVNAFNTGFIPGYATFDLGLRYWANISDREVLFRLYASNITDKNAWSATGSGLLQTNSPRTIKFSVSTSF